MAKTAFLSLTTFLSIFCLHSQEGPGNTYRLSTNPLQYYFTGYNITLERVQQRFLFGFDLTFKPSYCNSCPVEGGGHGLFGNYWHQNYWNRNYNSITITVYPKFYYADLKKYFSPQPYYRNWWFHQKEASYDNVEGYRFDGLRNELQHVLGIRFLFGKTYTFQLSSDYKFLLDYSFGPGIQYHWMQLETFAGTVYDIYHDYLHEYQTSFALNFQIRLQLGFQF